MWYRYSLSEVFKWVLTVALVLAAMRLLTPLAFGGASVVLLSSAAAWHFVESDGALVMFAALLGVVGAYLSVVQIIFFAGDLGSFPLETIVGLGCGGCFYGAICGVAVRVLHRGATRIASKPLGAKGWRGFAQFIMIGYAIVIVPTLLSRLFR